MIVHDLKQNTPEWHAFRLNKHGASEAAAMLGLSKQVSRSELLYIKHTGTPKTFSEWVQRHILDHGHVVEARARPIIEALIDEELYPATCSNEDEGGHLSASCDGLTLDNETAFEHKQWAMELAASVESGILPEEYMPQCQQIMLITGARRVIFTVSDGTPERCVHLEVFPDLEWFERIEAGWAQFDHDLAEYVIPEAPPVMVAEPVQTLPAVSVQIDGQIAVRENFKTFEAALRDFLDHRLIRSPQTDQDFIDLDGQIKAMKEAEAKLDAAEAMMLAQIESVDQAKRHKDMLAKLVREHRLMAEKLLASEKERRRAELVSTARQAFTAHLDGLQRSIDGLRLNIPVPDFAAAIKGLKTLTSIQDKLDTALANGKIAADQHAADVRAKLLWLDANAAEHRSLLADLQTLINKPFDDFTLAVTARIERHQREQAARLEAERERIRAEETARLERERKAREQAEQVSLETWQRQSLEQEEHQCIPAHHGLAFAEAALEREFAARVNPPAAPAFPLLKLGEINTALAPLSITADGLQSLGFVPASDERPSKRYRASDFPRMVDALIRHLGAIQINEPQRKAA